ncbi:hypothetical protein [Streptomyces sp. NBC_01233]|uniref:hypothetical protein n=1 Tax=Streptomyces sp. NBC_01233 TaxID=2903787 RepID=UPI002E1343F6|nr:hypothetical protein OG332_28070 [Streptomyces sp. NBC_01233]
MQIVWQGWFCGFSSVGIGAARALRRVMDPEIQERIAARRAELDGLEEQLVKQLAEVRAERDEPAVAERVWQRKSASASTRPSSPSAAQSSAGGASENSADLSPQPEPATSASPSGVRR